ncbi:MAG: helix-turn-helix domain-containing protein [Leptothrix sp. (in: b-proteobacteria)]
MDYPIRFSDQLRHHLRAMRKLRGLTQAELGQRIGVGQARIAEIESNPGVVSLDQLMNLLSVLNVSLMLSDNVPPAVAEDALPVGGQAQSPPAPSDAAMPVAPRHRVFQAKKGSW